MKQKTQGQTRPNSLITVEETFAVEYEFNPGSSHRLDFISENIAKVVSF